MCPTEVINVQHLGKFSKQQITLSRLKNFNFVTQEVFLERNIKVSFLTQDKIERKLLSEQIISTSNHKLIYPDSFVSGQLLDMNIALNTSTDIAGNILTPPPLLYLPSNIFYSSDKVVLIKSKNGQIESHVVRRFEFSFRLDETPYNVKPIIDSLAVEIFPFDRFAGQVYSLKFRIYLRNLGITGSGYIDINYERIFSTQEKQRQELKRAAINVVDQSEVERKIARVSRINARSVEFTASERRLPMLTAPFAKHSLNRVAGGL